MDYQYRNRVLCAGAPEVLSGIQRVLCEALGDLAGVQVVRLEGDAVVIAGPGSQAFETLDHPLPGPTVIAAADGAGGEVLAAVRSIWTDSSLVPPEVVEVLPENAVALVACAIARLQASYVSDAARRNVSLYQQIAHLRQTSEDLNTLVGALWDLHGLEAAGAHRLLHEIERRDGEIEIAPGGTARQRLPVTVIPALVAGVSFEARVTGRNGFSARLVTVEEETVVAELSGELEAGSTVVFLSTDRSIAPDIRLLDLVICNTGGGAMRLKAGWQEAPEEAIVLSGDDAPDAGSMQLALWTAGPNRSRQIEKAGECFEYAAPPKWRGEAERATPGFGDRNWLHRVGTGGLMVHPLPGAVALAACPVTSRPRACNGVAAKLELPGGAVSAVFVRLLVAKGGKTFQADEDVVSFVDDLDEGQESSLATRFLGGSGREGGGSTHLPLSMVPNKDEVWRSEWAEVLPGTSRVVSLSVSRPLGDFTLYVATTTRGKAVDFAQLTVSDLRLLVRAGPQAQ